MRRGAVVLVLVLAAATITAEELTVGMILSAQRAGADANGLVRLINDPVYTAVRVSQADLETLRTAGVPQEAIRALLARMPAPATVPSKPDDQRLKDVVRLVNAGLSESLIVDQIRGTGQSFDLTANDLVYLKENGVPEPVIRELLSTRGKSVAPVAAAAAVAAPLTVAAATVPPAETTITGLVLVKPTFLKKNRPGQMVVKQDDISWIDGSDAAESFAFKPGGIEKVWFTCSPRGMTNFCFQLNIKIAKGALYRFQDANKESGSNETIQKIEQNIKARYPNLVVGEPEIDD